MKALTFAAATLIVLLAACGVGSEVDSLPHRLLAEDISAGEPWNTEVVESSDEVPTFLEESLVDWETEVDWGNEVLFVFTLAESSSCPLGHHQGIEFSQSDLRLYPVVEVEGSPSACTDDANPHTVAVAIQRDDLPSEEFSVWVEADEPPPGVVDGVTHMAAGELTSPQPSDPDVPRLDNEGTLKVGQTRLASSVTTHCGLDRIFRPIDDRQWMMEDAPDQLDYVPDEWLPFVEGEQVDLLVERSAEDRLTVAPVGSDHSRIYVPADDRVGCD